jgi:redoxin
MKLNIKGSTILLLGFFVLSLAITGMLTKSLRSKSQAKENLRLTRDVPGLALGETVKVPQFKNLKGEAKSVQVGPSGYALLIIFSTQCDSCQKDAPFWTRLAAEADKKKTSHYLVCVNAEAEKVQSFLDQFSLGNHPVLVDSNNELETMLKGIFVPQYLLLSSEGRVAGRWAGLSHTDPQGKKAVEPSEILNPIRQ